MDNVKRVIELLIQTQDDVKVILQSTVLQKPSTRASVTCLTNVTAKYNEGVSDALDMLIEDG